MTREPGGTPIAEQIRTLILAQSLKGISPLAELLLYEASRAEHVENRILPALKRGAVVISDRFADSSLVYQGAARRLPKELIEKLNRVATGGLKPNLTFLFDLPPETGFARLKGRAPLDRMESEGMAFHRRVRRGYRELQRREPKRCVLIRAIETPEKISEMIFAELQRRKFL